MRLFCLYLLLLSFSGCIPENNGPVWTRGGKHKIAILPFSDADSLVTAAIKQGLENRLNVEVTILKKTALPYRAFYRPRQRYLADTLLVFMEQTNNSFVSRYEKVLGICSSDIAIRKNETTNWGVMGLGQNPGVACVISSFRAKKSATSQQHLINRMIVLGMHELGHTWSLPHCSDNDCLMQDAEGKMKLDRSDKYCNGCMQVLRSQRVLH